MELVERLRTAAKLWKPNLPSLPIPRLPRLPTRWLLPLTVPGLIALTALLRCLHLLKGDHYYLLSADSHYFHWQAGRIIAGEGVPTDTQLGMDFPLHSGLTYPLTYLAKAMSGVFGLSSPDALDLACKVLPPVLGILTAAVIYVVATKICDRRVGLFAALAWAVMNRPVFFGAAGYVDRDGLSILLVVMGAFLFYAGRFWRLRIGNIDIGWLIAGLGVLGIEALLYLEWSFVGPVLLLSIVATYFVVRLLIGYSDRLVSEPSAKRRLAAALAEANWRTFIVILLVNVLGVASNTQLASRVFTFVRITVQLEGESGVAEMQGISLAHIIDFRFFLIPMAIALYIAFKRRHEAAIFLSCWFLALLCLSLFANRVLLYAAPAAALLSGVGLALLWDKMNRGEYQGLKKTGVAVLLILMIIYSFPRAYNMGSNPFVAASDDWQDATTFIRENTPQEAIIMTQWGWGYWILDMAQRRSVVDNGFYGWDYFRNYDVGTIYSTSDPAEAAQIMKEKYHADYLVFYKKDVDFAPTIMGWADLDEKYKGIYGFPEDSLYTRSFNLELDKEELSPLEVVYRSSPDSEIVILKLNQSAEP